MSILLIAALSFYGVTFDPATTNQPSSSRIVPINFAQYKMTQPDGVVRYLARDFTRPGVLQGQHPWLGVIDKNTITVWADPNATEGKRRTAFTFVNGQLRNLYLDGTDYHFKSGAPSLDGSLGSLWKDRSSRSFERGSKADIWRNGDRLRLWFANPNSAGLFCVQIALIGLLLLLKGRGLWRVHGVLWMAMALFGMAQSGSRGALLGFAAGALLMVATSIGWRLRWRSVLTFFCVVALLVGAVAVSGFAKRFTETIGSVDSGNQRRLVIAEASLRMLADAPFGWGCGDVAGRHAALNWYAPSESHVIRTHLLTVGELGWFVGGAYIFMWLALLALGFAAARRGNPWALGEVTALGLAGFFNPVYTEGTLWIVPGLACAVSLWWFRGSGGGFRKWLTTVLYLAAAAFFVMGGLVLAGNALNRGRSTVVQSTGTAVQINRKSPTVWVVEDTPVLGGFGFPGREILLYYAEHPVTPGLGYVTDIAALPKEVERLVLPGRAAERYLEAYRNDPQSVCHAKQVLFLSPSVGPDAVDARLLAASKVQWFAGVFAAVRDKSYGRQYDWVYIIPGVERYVPNWMRLALFGGLRSGREL